MITIKFFIRTIDKKKESNIRVRIYSGKKFDLTALSQKQINPAYWSSKKGKIKDGIALDEVTKLQKDLDDLESLIKKDYNNEPDKSVINKDWLTKTIDKYYNPNKYISTDTLFGYIQHFISNSEKRTNPRTGNPVCYKMRREYEATFAHLQTYAKEYGEPDFMDIDLDFYYQFIDHLRQKQLATNTIGKKIQTLKIFLNAAFEQGIHSNQKYKSSKFIALNEEVENIYLNKDELNKFYRYDFSKNKKLERVRDLFIVGAWTGLRYSDLGRINKDKIKGEFLVIKQSKTGGKVTIPIHPAVNEILEKYYWKLPELISNQKFNEYLKDAAAEADIDEVFFKTVYENGVKVEKKFHKHELIRTHTMRRSFCTNAYKDNIPTVAIMAISGHKTESAFLKYIKADDKEHAEKVLEIWKQNMNFLKVVE